MAINTGDCPIINIGLGREVAERLNDMYGISPNMTSTILGRVNKQLGSDGFSTVDEVLNDEGFKRSLAISTGIGKPAIITDKELFERLDDLYNQYVEAGYIAENGFVTVGGMEHLDSMATYLGGFERYKALDAPRILFKWGDAHGNLHAYAAKPKLMKGLGEPSDTQEDDSDLIITRKGAHPTLGESFQKAPEIVNIYAGNNENTELSNMAVRPFTITLYSKNGKKELQLYSVEQGFQLAKMINLQNLLKANHSKASIAAAERITPIIDKLMVEKNPFEASKLGKTRIPTRSPEVKQLIDEFFGEKELNFFGVTEEWNRAGVKLMENLIRESFEQNPEAKQKLIDTGNAILTHKQAQSPWRERFPEILMKVRSEFQGSSSTDTNQSSRKEGQPLVKKIISGGQTGVDTLGLIIASEIGIPTEGIAPKGYRRENNLDGVDIRKFGLREITDEEQADYTQRTGKTDPYTARTELNVRNSDVTVYFYSDNDRGGMIATQRAATEWNKPFIVNPTADQLRTWIIENNIAVLNVAGNRGSKFSNPKEVRAILTQGIVYQAELPQAEIIRKERQRIREKLESLSMEELSDAAEFAGLDPSTLSHIKSLISDAFENNLKDQFAREEDRARENENDTPQTAFRRKFPNKNMLSHLAESLVRNMSTIVNELQDDEKIGDEFVNAPRILGKYYPKYKHIDFTQVERKEILLNNELFEIIRNRAARMLFSGKAKDPSMQEYLDMFSGDKTKGIDNRTLLLHYARGILRRTERVKILEDGTKKIDPTKINTTEPQVNVTEAIDDDEDIKTEQEIADEDKYMDGEGTDYESNDHYKMADDIRSASDKITQRIKIMLSQVPNVQVIEGELRIPDDPYGLGTKTYVDEGRAINTLLNVLNGADTIEAMITRLKNNVDTYPWFTYILQRIDQRKSESISREKLRNEFFASMRKDKTVFTSVMMILQDDGTYTTRYVERNRGLASRKNKANLVAQFDIQEGLPIFKFHHLDFYNKSFLFALTSLKPTIITTVENDNERPQSLLERMGKRRVSNLTTRLSQLYQQNRKALYEGVDPYIDTEDADKTSDFYAIFQTIKDFGIEISGNAFYAMAMADMRSGRSDFRQTNIGRIMSSLYNIAKQLNDFKESDRNNHTYDYYNPMEFHSERGKNPIYVYPEYSNILDIVGAFTESATESMAYVDHRAHYAFNYPTFIQSTIAKLSGQYVTDQERNEFFAKRYDNDWYSYFDQKGNRHYYIDILEQIKNNGNIGNLDYMQKLDCDGIDYRKMSPKTYALSILSDYFNQRDRNTAVYRAPIASDKPAMDTIRWRRIHDKSNTDSNFRTVIGDQVWNVFMQEIQRSRRVLLDSISGKTPIDNFGIKFKKNENEKKAKHNSIIEKMMKKSVKLSDLFIDDSGEYIYADSGVGFKQVRFMQGFLQDGMTTEDPKKQQRLEDFRKAIVDAIFNGSTNVTSFGDIFQDIFDSAMLGKVDSNIKYLEEIGLLEMIKNEKMLIEEGEELDEEGRAYTYKYKYLNSILEEFFYDNRAPKEIMPDYVEGLKTLLFDAIEEFVYNNYIMQIQMIELFGVDLAYYNGTTDFQKRMAQTRSTGQKLNKAATIFGERVSDDNFRTITVSSVVHKAYETEEIEKMLREYAATIDNAKERNTFIKSIPEIIKLYEKNDATDGQAINCLSSLRKKHILAAKWTYSREDKRIGEVVDGKMFKNENSHTDEAVYQRVMNGIPLPSDYFHVFTQIDKPFVYDVSVRNGSPVPIQQKNAEYTHAIINMRMSDYAPKDPISILIQMMEDTYRIDPKTGIDTINFDSAIKVGNSKSINVEAESAALKTELRSAMFSGQSHGSNRYNPDYVTTIDIDSYSYQQNNPEHFIDHKQLLGSQMKILSIINTKDDDLFDFSAQKTFKSIVNDKELRRILGVELVDSSHITGKTLKKVYFNILAQRTKLAEAILRDNLHLNEPRVVWLRKIGEKLESTMAMDSKYNADDIRAVRVSNGNFVLAAEDPAQAANIKAATASWVKKAMYKQEILGGPLVQATNFGKNKKLKAVFRDGKFQYFETIITMPKQIRRLLQNKNGEIDKRFYDYEREEWKMGEIVSELKSLGALDMLNILLYRIPSEGKYSIFPCKVVGFAKSAGGSIVELPDVGTTVAGFDFDTDKLFGVMKEYSVPRDSDKKPVEYTPDADPIRSKMIGYNNAVFDLQWLSLTSQQSATEIFDPGNFEDLTDLSFQIELMRAKDATGENIYDIEDIGSMSPTQLKAEWTKLNDMDPADLETMIKLHDQNMSSKEMLGIAAVANISHAQLGMFVNQDEDAEDPTKKPSFDSKKIRQTVPLGVDVKLRWFESGKEEATELDLVDENSQSILIDERNNIEGYLISRYLRKYVGAAADAAKNPTLSRLGADKATFPVIQWMLRARVPMKLAHLYTSLPVFKQLSMIYKSLSDSGNPSIDTAINYLESQIFRQNKASFRGFDNLDSYIGLTFYNEDGSPAPMEITIDEEQCMPWIYYDDMNPYDKIRTLEEFRVLSGLSQKLTTLSNYGRINSVIAGPKPTIEENEAIRDKIDKAESLFEGKDPDFIGFSFDDLQRLMPYETQMYHSILELLEAIQGPLFPSYQSESYNQILSILSNIAGGDLSAEMKMRVNEAQKMYALALSARDLGGQEFIMMYDDDQVKKFFVDFPTTYMKRLKDLKGKNEDLEDELNKNLLLQEIGEPMPPTADCPIWTLNTSIFGANEDFKYKITQAWQSLIYYQNEEMLPEDIREVHELGLDLFRYFTLRTRGKGFDSKTPWHMAPLDAKLLIPGYNDRLKKMQSFVVPAGEFALQFVLNNAERQELIDFIPEDKLAQSLDGYVPNSASGEVKIRPEFFNSEDRDIMKLFDISIGEDESYIRLYPIKNIGKDRVIIFGEEENILSGQIRIPLKNIYDEKHNVIGRIIEKPIKYKVFHRLGIPGVISEYYPYLRNSIYQGLTLNGNNPVLLNSENEDTQLTSYNMRGRSINVRADLLGINVNEILLEEAGKLGYNIDEIFKLSPINSRVSPIKAANMLKLHNKALLELLGFKIEEKSKQDQALTKSLLESIRERLKKIC